MTDFLINEFYQKMQDKEIVPYGILDANNEIHTLGTDSKILGRIFEMYTQPVLKEIAENHGLMLTTPASQTLYPDFVMMSEPESKEKIAIDVKSTYIDSDSSVIKFTLGSYASYMRNNTKNIEYAYTDYSKHYVVGYVYRRNGNAQQSQVYGYKFKSVIKSPIMDVKYFIQEKYKIAGDKPGSGNTENIGSFSTKKFNDLKNGNGPFCELGQDVYDIYWKYYPTYRSVNKTYTSLNEFINWFLAQPQESIKLLHPFDYQSVLEKIQAYAKKARNP